MPHQSVFDKVMDLFVSSGKLLVPKSPEEMVMIAIFSQFKWALIKYIQMGIVSLEVSMQLVIPKQKKNTWF